MKIVHKSLFDLLKRIRNLIAILILLFTLSLLTECVVFQHHALRYKETSMSFTGTDSTMSVQVKNHLAKLTADETNALMVQRENERLIAQYKGEEYQPQEDETLVEKQGAFYRKIKQTTITLPLTADYYIHKLSVSVPMEENGGYQVSLYLDDSEVKSDLYCSIDAKIDAGIMNVSSLADKLVIVIHSKDELALDKLKIGISNDFHINILRLLFFFTLYCGVAFFFFDAILQGTIFWKHKRNNPVFVKDIIVKKIEWVFAVTAFCLGMLLIVGIGTNQVGFDEYAHAKTAYDLSFGSTIETTEAAMQMKGNLLPFFNNSEERALVEAYEQKVCEEIDPDITFQSRMVRTETRVYYPIAAGFKLGRILKVDFSTMVALAKMGNLLMYIAVVWLAIRIARQYKLLLVLIGLLPNNIFIASSITYDGVVTAFLLLGYTFLLNEILEYHSKMKWKNVLAMLICFEIGSLSKPIYIVMALMIVFFGKNKFVNRFQEIVLKLAVIAMACLMLYNIFHPTPVAGGDYALVSNFSYAGDPRNTGASVTGQISYILGNPLTYAGLLLSSMGSMLLQYLTCQVPFVGYAYLGFASGIVNWIFILLGLIAAHFTSRENQYFVASNEQNVYKKSAIGMKNIWLTLLMCFGLSAIIWTSMYVSYTAVGANVIEGVQGRYFIPLFLPFFSCFFLKRGQTEQAGKLRKLWYQMEPSVVYGNLIFITFMINMLMTYSMVIHKLNM